MNDPKTYWEKRSSLTDQVLNNFMVLVGQSLPHLEMEIATIFDAVNDAITDLDAEYAEKEKADLYERYDV